MSGNSIIVRWKLRRVVSNRQLALWVTRANYKGGVECNSGGLTQGLLVRGVRQVCGPPTPTVTGTPPTSTRTSTPGNSCATRVARVTPSAIINAPSDPRYTSSGGIPCVEVP